MLVVDDDVQSLRELERTVRRLGHDCRTAADGLQAWELHRAAHADVILSAWKLPRLDGLDLCRRTRVADDDRAYTYFILLAHHGDREHFLRGMEAGADDYHTKPVDIDELRARLASAARVIGVYRTLAAQNVALRRDSITSFEQARIDPLTGVFNRLRMNEDLAVLWAQKERYGRRSCGALCDIDWFKAYNDHFGHVAGDSVLRCVARSIQGQIRRGDVVYRYGGEEFFVVLPEQTVAEAKGVMERVRRAIEDLRVATVAGGGVVTVSVGVAAPHGEDRVLEDWLQRVDQALYAAKAKGRNRVDIEG